MSFGGTSIDRLTCVMAVVATLCVVVSHAGRTPDKPMFISVKLPTHVLAISASDPQAMSPAQVENAVQLALDTVVNRVQNLRKSEDPASERDYKILVVQHGSQHNPIDSIQIPASAELISYDPATHVATYDLVATYVEEKQVAKLRGSMVVFLCSHAEPEFSDTRADLLEEHPDLYAVALPGTSASGLPANAVATSAFRTNAAYKSGFDMVTFCANVPSFIKGIRVDPIVLTRAAAHLWGVPVGEKRLVEVSTEIDSMAAALEKRDYSKYPWPNLLHLNRDDSALYSYSGPEGFVYEDKVKRWRIAVIDYEKTNFDRVGMMCWGQGSTYSMDGAIAVQLYPSQASHLKFNDRSYSARTYPLFTVRPDTVQKILHELELPMLQPAEFQTMEMVYKKKV